ncbi:MAG: class I SAM-dependent methyltransferase [Verrucomicrobiales bacterium]|nr:class I SAM-dependent methyltransferase [Verrucomicrobiales bacterium]
MQSWKEFWTEYPASVDEQEFLVQVGHTINGKPYSRPQFETMIASVRGSLQLGSDDVLIDICCGNGVVTVELAKHCRSTLGVDFSVPLITVARKFNAGDKISYRVMNALELDALPTLAEGPFSRVLMYAALQHFEPQDLMRLLTGFLKHTGGDRIIVLGGVLDVERKLRFLDTQEKLQMYERYQMEGRDRLGTWWKKDFVSDVCKELGLRCEIDDHSDGRPGGHYRFDAKIS